MTVGPATIDFRSSMTVEAVKNEIRSRCVFQGGGLELDGLVLIEGELLFPEQHTVLWGAFLKVNDVLTATVRSTLR